MRSVKHRKRLLARFAAVLGIAALLTPASPVYAGQGDPPVIQRLLKLTRATKWTQVAAIKIRFRTFHPQGMVKIGEDFYVSSVEIIQLPRKLAAPIGGHDYDAGSGVGHLFKIGPDGRLLSDLVLGEGSIYHPGGIDYDGTSIWVPVSEYRPNSRALLYKVDPETMLATKVTAFADHIGGLVHDVQGHQVVGITWGSRRFYTWPLTENGTIKPHVAPSTAENPDQYIDYQDCHYVGGRKMLCAGVADYRADSGDQVFQLGGFDLVDLSDHRPLWQVPIELRAPSGRIMTQNPFWVETTKAGLRAYFMPDDDVSAIYVFDATPA